MGIRKSDGLAEKMELSLGVTFERKRRNRHTLCCQKLFMKRQT